MAWLADTRAGHDALLLASSTTRVDDLNARARADLVREGRVAVDGVPLHNGTAAGVGDRIATRRNDRRNTVNHGKNWVKNGDGWTVSAVHDNGSLTVQHRRHHGRAILAADYVAQHVELDYARTVRRAQGLTVDHAHLVVDPQMSRPEFYVGASRRQGTQLYVPLLTDPGPDHRPEMTGLAREILTQIITCCGMEPSAHEAIKTAVDQLGDLRRMASEYDHAVDVRTGVGHRLVAEAAHPGITLARAWPAVARRLQIAEGFGRQAAAVIAKADRLGSYTDATSTARVLAYRLDLLLNRSGHGEEEPAVPRWLAAAPPTSPSSGITEPGWTRYLDARYTEIADRITTLTDQAAQQEPPWLHQIGYGEARTEAIRQTVAYRAVYDHTGEDALGPEPEHRGRQHDAWVAAGRAIDTSRPQTGPAPHGAPNAVRLLAQLEQNTNDSIDNYTALTRCGPARST